MTRMKTLLLCGSHGNQKALANKIAQAVTLDAIVAIVGSPRKRVRIRTLAGRKWQQVCSVTVGYPFRRAWFKMLRHYDVQYREFPLPPVLLCTDVNDPSVFELIAQLQPDLVIVSGTNLLKPALIEEIHKHGPVMNLHTGLSPYVKGGPSCTYWCLALRQFGLIGNTVMWINAGIDSGDLIATERTHLTAEESLLELNIAVMEHAHALYAKCVSRFLQKDELPCVSQDQLSSGRLFLGKDWGFVEMVMALFNYYVYFRPGSPFFRTPEGVQLISIE